MPPKKSRSKDAFQSIRIIGQRAQDIITRAKETAKQEEKNKVAKKPERKEEPVVTMQLSVLSVAKATFAVLCVVVGVWLLFHLRHKLLLLFLAMFVATVIDPGVNRLERWGLPRGIAILLQYTFAIFVILFLVIQLIPLIAIQIQQIAITINVELQPFVDNPQINIPFVDQDSETYKQLARLIDTSIKNLSIKTFFEEIQQAASNYSDVAEYVRYIARIAGSVGKFVASFAVVLVLSFFMQMEKERITKWSRSFIPLKYRKYADLKAETIQTKMSQWMKGELTLMFSIFLLTLVALLILRMPYALTLALFAGICEFFPAVGPLVAAIPAILIAGTQKGFIWIPIVAGVYYIIQWCENNLLVPLIMRKAVGLSPIAILFAMMVGISFPDTIHPVLGIMLAVPTTTILAVFLEDWRESKNNSTK